MVAEALVFEVAKLDDVAGILDLQQRNLRTNGGSLTAEFSADWFTSVIAEMPVIVARDGDRIVGYMATSPLSATAHVPVSQAKLVAYPPPPNAYNFGPVCVDSAVRGRGVPRLMLNELRKLLPERTGIGFVRADNQASLAAHAKMGLQQVAEFRHAAIDYVVIILSDA